MEKPKVFTKNMYGIDVVMCCASCKYKRLDKNNRLCTIGEGPVPADYLCKNWEMNDVLAKVGRGEGRVKKREYLQHALEASIARDAPSAQRLSGAILETRSKYQKEHGGIYEVE